MFLVPKYLGDYLGYQGEIVYPKNEENAYFHDEYRGVKLTSIHSLSQYNCTLWSEKEMAWWLIKNAKDIDLLCLFWLNQRNLIFAKIYKLINPKGKCYIKGDIGIIDLEYNNKSIKSKIKQHFLKSIDVLSVETEYNFNLIKKGIFGEHLSKATVLMSNGFDIELFEKFNITKKRFTEKKNLLITVGRIGHSEKNNEMMLAALDGMEMGTWKFIMVGNIEKDFVKIYDDFIIRNPDKKEKVFLSGAINDKNKLWEIYNDAKVFLLTSPKECMAQVFSEALAFGNYIVSTNVAGTDEISKNRKLGKIIEVADTIGLRIVLKDIFDSKIDLENNYNEAIELSDSKFNWRQLVKFVGNKLK